MFLYWIDKKRLAGASEPSLADIPFLKTFEFNGLVCLQENSTEDIATLLGIQFLQIPIQDYSVPSDKDLEKILEFFYDRQKERPNIPILIHCEEGHGRTGTILASLLVLIDQISPQIAISRIRKINPLAIETEDQEKYILSLNELN